MSGVSLLASRGGAIGFSAHPEIHSPPLIYIDSIFSSCMKVKDDIWGIIEMRKKKIPSLCIKTPYLYWKEHNFSSETNKRRYKIILFCNRIL